MLLCILASGFAMGTQAQQPQQPPTATQILGQQLGAVAAQNAELVEQINKLRSEMATIAKERDDLKAKQEAKK